MEALQTERPQPTLQELLPGGMSTAGFLKEGQTLEQVLERDRRVLELLGYTTQEVADLLGPITEQAVCSNNFEYTAPNGKQYEVRVKIWRGYQECPWRCRVDWRRSSGAIDMFLTEKGKDNGPVVHIPGLLRHLIEEHGFFEGGKFRVAPETIIEMFGVERIPGSLEQAKRLEL